jgi:hypothetical protein
MNCYEKHSLMMDNIEYLEKRLGAYLSIDGCEKTDSYAKALIEGIAESRANIIELLNRPVSEVGENK